MPKLWPFLKGAGMLGLGGLGVYGGYNMYKRLATNEEAEDAKKRYDDNQLLSLLQGDLSNTLAEGGMDAMLDFDAQSIAGAMGGQPGSSVRVRPSRDFQSLLSEADLMRLQSLRMRRQRTKSEILADLGVFDEEMGF